MKNLKNIATKLGLLAIVGGSLLMGGCATTAPTTIAKVDKSGKGEMYVLVNTISSQASAADVCANSPKAAEDTRCAHPGDYYGVSTTPTTEGFVNPAIAVLVPNTAKVRNNDIIKIQMVDGMAAFYEGTFGRLLPGFQRDETQPCYFKRNLTANGGVVCPKFGWSYKDLR